ncbi:hypothetical protein N8T08_000398 [Aspergillus melleus]|uniref:Uncharacterized protein n=1 Tax=Aspergillus melleus TaxID=138277 RepID=A0ACC3BB42_9EURO|nr:hypothetical protein N8T08_000398 [Aspergillus melleus]
MGSHLISREEIGNDAAAQDLYGLGVRLGLYMQALAMMLYLYGDEKTYGKGLKVASGSITVSILASWFCYAAKEEFSPSEAIVVLIMLMGLSFPAKYTLINPYTVIGETIGVITLLVTEFSTCAALLWTFARLVHTLPRLGTPNVIFFFARVSVTGWFRYLALVLLSIDAASSLYVSYRIVRVMMIAWKAYGDGRREPDAKERKTIDDTMKWKKQEFELTITMWLIWIFAIIAAEMSLYWNHLTPSNDLYSSGQLIPFVAGLILLIDRVEVALL